MSSAVSVSLRQWPDNASGLSDADFLRSCRFHSTASRDLVVAASAGDCIKFGRLWRKQLPSRREPLRWTRAELLSSWTSWQTVESEFGRAIRQSLPPSFARAGRRPALKPGASWADRVAPLAKIYLTESPRRSPVEVLAALEILWTRGHRLPQTLWWPLWRITLNDCMQMLSPDRSNATADTHAATSHADDMLLLYGELPLLAGLVYGDLAGSRELLQRGQRVLHRELSARTDTDGTPHSELLSRLPFWLAPLIRATAWSQQAGQSIWDEDERQLLSDVVEKAVAICRHDGQLALTSHGLAPALTMLTCAADLLQWPRSHLLRTCLADLNSSESRPRSRSASPAVSVMPSNQSDWARFALLRTDWTAQAASAAITHHQSLPQLDVMLSGRTLLHGDWGLELVVDGARVELAEEWNCVCWESQPEADYVELQMSGPGRMQVERLLMLSRTDRFLLMADAVSGAPADGILLKSRLPLASGLGVQQDPGQRSWRLAAGKQRARLFPLLLPVDTVHSTPHHCRPTEAGLELEVHATGRGVFSPIILDFAEHRQRQNVIWRSLTVTEDGGVVPPDAAAAFRWQLAREQWLVYRSLKPPKTPRAALGYHTGNAFAIGRFDAQGNVDPLVMVES